jgi:hypothetical protein
MMLMRAPAERDDLGRQPQCPARVAVQDAALMGLPTFQQAGSE